MTQGLLITGSTGFLGRYCMERLARESRLAPVTEWDRSVHGSLLDSREFGRVLLRERPAQVLHLAWVNTGTAKYEQHPQNMAWAEATLRLATLCRRHSVRFVGVGTGLEVDAAAEMTPYLQSKSLVSREIENVFGGDESGFSWVRPFWIFSTSDLRPRVLRLAALAEARGGTFTPRNPNLSLDFIHVKDVAAGFAAILTHNDLVGHQDLGSGQLRTVQELLGLLPSRKFARAQVSEPERSGAVAQMERLVAHGWWPHHTEHVFRSHGIRATKHKGV